MCLGESRLLSQPRMAMVAWAALFSLPPAYAQSSRALHAITQEMLDFALAVLDAGATQPLIESPSATFQRFCMKPSLYLIQCN